MVLLITLALSAIVGCGETDESTEKEKFAEVALVDGREFVLYGPIMEFSTQNWLQRNITDGHSWEGLGVFMVSGESVGPGREDWIDLWTVETVERQSTGGARIADQMGEDHRLRDGKSRALACG